MKPEKVYWFRGALERITTRCKYGRRRVRTHWLNAYSAGTEDLDEQPWMGKRECQKEAKAAGCRAVFKDQTWSHTLERPALLKLSKAQRKKREDWRLIAS